MKKTVRIVAVLLLLLLLCGCGAKAPETPAPTPTPAATAAPQQTEASVEGTVLDGSLNALTILTDDGRILSFSTRTADKSGCTGLLIDTRVTVFYTGEIEGEETRRCTVTRLVQ